MSTPKRFRRPTPHKPSASSVVSPAQTQGADVTGPSPLPRGEGCPKGGVGAEANKEGGHPESGRAVSARNATTHGLFARDVVLPSLGEDPAAYEALLAQFCAQLPPRNLLERHYLEQIAAASWRLRRLHRWQAQVYEDPTLTEDQRLDRLDKVLRHETALTRQIDRAVRTLNRDAKWLFESRARAEALYHRDLTENEIRQTPELDIEVQRLVWRQLRPTPAPDLGDARLDTAPPTEGTRICQNEPPPIPIPPLLRPGSSDRSPRGMSVSNPPFQSPIDWDRRESDPPYASQNCQNEPPPIPPPNLPFRGDPAEQGREVQSPVGITQKCENEPRMPLSRMSTDTATAELAYRKREQELYRQYHPQSTKPEIDWDSEDAQFTRT